jgi:hypothetical protein
MEKARLSFIDNLRILLLSVPLCFALANVIRKLPLAERIL